MQDRLRQWHERAWLRRQPRTRRLAVLAAVGLCVLVAADAAWRTADVARHAHAARDELREVRAISVRIVDSEGALVTTDDLDRLRQAVVDSEAHATRARSRLGYLRYVAPLGGWVPRVGTAVGNAPAMLDLAVDVSRGGREVLDAMSPVLTGDGAIMPRVREAVVANGDAVNAGLARILAAAKRADGLATLDWRGPFASVQPMLEDLAGSAGQVAAARDALAEARGAIDVLTGYQGEQHLLVLGQNDHEIRATGGFIGTLGLITIRDGEIVASEFGDSGAFAPGEPLTPPAAFTAYYGASEWHVRDANWWPDFPTSAEAAIWFIERDRGIQVDGVIAVDTTMLGLLVSQLGPIALPEMAAPAPRPLGEWSLHDASLELTAEGGRLVADASEARHAFTYARRDVVQPGDGVTVTVDVAAADVTTGGHRWVAFGDSSDSEWHAAFFDLALGKVAAPFGEIDGASIEGIAPGWYRLSVTYRPIISSGVTVHVEVAGDPGATGGFAAAGHEALTFDRITLAVNGVPLDAQCGESASAGVAWEAATSDGRTCRLPVAFPEPLTGANWLREVERNLAAEGSESGKAAYLVPLLEEVLRRMSSPSVQDAAGLVRASRAGVAGRHLQGYHVDPDVQALFGSLGMSGEFVASEGSTLFAVIDNNVSESKVQPAITRDVTYLAGLDGSVTVFLDWRNRVSEMEPERYQRLTASGVVFDPLRLSYTRIPGVYGAYVRVYLPEGSIVTSVTGFTHPWRFEQEHGHAVAAGYVAVEDGESQRVVVEFRPPEPAETLYLWKQGGNVQGTWRVLVNEPGGVQSPRFEGTLERDTLVPLR